MSPAWRLAARNSRKGGLALTARPPGSAGNSPLHILPMAPLAGRMAGADVGLGMVAAFGSTVADGGSPSEIPRPCRSGRGIRSCG